MVLNLIDIPNKTLVQIGSYKLDVNTLIDYILATLVFLIVLYGFRKAIYNLKKIDISRKYSIYNLTKYLLSIIYFLVLLDISGVKLSLLLAGSAALLVGVGIGIQSLFNDFISGIIILLDSSIRVNDIINVNDLICRVKEIKLRTTTVVTRDDIYILLPNSSLTKNNIENYTHHDASSRFDIIVGVDYNSDVDTVVRLLKESALSSKHVKSTPEPTVQLKNFGDSALIFRLMIWSEDIFSIEKVKSDIRFQILKAFKEHHINIPFPQNVVTLNPTNSN